MKYYFPVTATALLFGSIGVSVSQTTPSPAVNSSAASYCRDLASYAKRNPKRARFFGDVTPWDQPAATSTPTPEWREFKSPQAREEAGNIYDTADLWSRKGKIVFAQFGHGTPSGDWAQYVNYCFRADGSLAKLEDYTSAFHGNVRIEKEMVYDYTGRLRFSTRCFDLKTDRKKRCDGNYAQYDLEVFRTIRQLPMYRLIRPQGTE